MNRLAPVFVAVGAIIFGFTTQLALAHDAFSGRISARLIPYLFGYACSLLSFIIAGTLFYKQESRKPLIVPLRYGRFDDGVRKINGRWHKADGTPFTVEEVLIGRQVGKFGLFVKNEGEAAYEITASEPNIGTSRLRFETGRPRLAKDEGEEFFPAFIETSPHNIANGSGLFDMMRSQSVPEIEVFLNYKDADNRWYQTTCKIERDVLAHDGLTVRYVRQKRSSAPKV